MVHYKFTYFGLRGRGESIRLAFVVAGVAYEDNRIYLDAWPALKASGECPFAQLPILDVDGVTLAQSKSILRYVSKQHGLAPTDEIQLAEADMLTDEVHDLENIMCPFYWEPDAEKKKSLTEKFLKETLPRHCGYLEKLLTTNNRGQGGYFVGRKLTYADLAVFSFFNGFIGGGKAEVPEHLTGDFPVLVEWYKRIMNEPKILEWLQKRPPNFGDYPY